jgi:hypothetical protein
MNYGVYSIEEAYMTGNELGGVKWDGEHANLLLYRLIRA